MRTETMLVALAMAASLVVVQGAAAANGKCTYELVQSMPDGIEDLAAPQGVTVTHEALLEMIEGAKKTLSIASFYVYLTDPEFGSHPSTRPGRQIMEAILRAASRGVKVEVALDKSTRREMGNKEDVRALEEIATVKFLNMTRLQGGGVLHSKFLIADNETFYVGSSNFDWRSYTQIKEMGMAFKLCPELAHDMDKIFRTYMLMADASQADQGGLPERLTDDLKTNINMETPLVLDDMRVFLSGSPPDFNHPKGVSPSGRTEDIDALLHVIDSAQKRLDISVMNYSPRLEFGWPRKWWPVIDNALRRAAAERRVQVRLLFSSWGQSKALETVWYKSLNAMQSEALKGGGIHVKLFRVPAFDEFQKTIPFARVKHDKYMVSERALFVGTSNWTPDYFTNTCGVSVVIEPTNQVKTPTAEDLPKVITSMQEIFEQDFNSQYAHELE